MDMIIRALRAFISLETDKPAQLSYFYGLSDSNTVTRLRQDIMCGENRLIKHGCQLLSQSRVHRLGKDRLGQTFVAPR